MDHFGEVLHNSYVNSGLALRALFGPGRDLLFDGLRASKNVSPNMNSLLRFESVASFIISVVSLLYPGLDWDATQHSLMNWSCFLVSCSLGVLWKKG